MGRMGMNKALESEGKTISLNLLAVPDGFLKQFNTYGGDGSVQSIVVVVFGILLGAAV